MVQVDAELVVEEGGICGLRLPEAVSLERGLVKIDQGEERCRSDGGEDSGGLRPPGLKGSAALDQTGGTHAGTRCFTPDEWPDAPVSLPSPRGPRLEEKRPAGRSHRGGPPHVVPYRVRQDRHVFLQRTGRGFQYVEILRRES